MQSITKNLFAALLLASLALSGLAHARSAVPIEDIKNATLIGPPGKTLSLEDVQTALYRAGLTKGWTIQNTAPGQASGTLVVRNKHTVKVDITYTDKSLSITYKSSENMKYEVNDSGQPLIHPYYNKWIHELMRVVNLELAKL
jgi:hypothetical protein